MIPLTEEVRRSRMNNDIRLPSNLPAAGQEANATPGETLTTQQSEGAGSPSCVPHVPQKKMLTFLASNTFWSRIIFLLAIFHEPAARRSTSRRAPT